MAAFMIDASGREANKMDRRDFLKTSIAAAGVAVVGIDCSRQKYLSGEAYFPQSVASGDPKNESVILWTRVEDATRSTSDVVVNLEMATDESFTELISWSGEPHLVLEAKATFNHCLKVRVTKLSPSTTYYYRFIYEDSAGDTYASNTGRTKTAPEQGADVSVKFAVISCQDYNGRYYNTMRQLANEEVDFIVHLGDYIYETTGNPSFQTTAVGRSTEFSSPDEAIVFNAGTDSEYYAARSLGNYREIYQLYRADADLQRLHERYPFVVTWDDHEFSDDSWGANANYFAGEQNELDVNRRQAATRAWFEFMPLDYMDDPDFIYDDSVPPPSDIRIYRDFTFGKHVHLVMTDLRTHRSDHVVPEKSAPWAIAVTASELIDNAAELETFVGQPADDSAGFYVEALEQLESVHQTLLRDKAPSYGVPADELEAALSGPISVDFINLLVAELDDGTAAIDTTALPRGIAYHHIGKWSYYSALGSRQLVVNEPYRIVAWVHHHKREGGSEQGMGDVQRAWFLESMRTASATWKVWGSEFVFSPLIADVVGMVASERFGQRFVVNADDWHCLPNRREEIFQQIAPLENVVVLAGDLHAFFASLLPGANANQGIVEFVTGGISSKTWRNILLDFANSDADLRDAGAAGLAVGIDQILQNKVKSTNPHLAFSESNKHGYVVIEAGADELVATYHMIDAKHAQTDLGTGSGLTTHFEQQRFRVKSGTHALDAEIDGAWQQWSKATMTWVPISS
jgi:alkaline phosphatase D